MKQRAASLFSIAKRAVETAVGKSENEAIAYITAATP